MFNRLVKCATPCLLCLVFLMILMQHLATLTPAHSQAVPDAKVNPPLGEGATESGPPPISPGRMS